MRRLTRFLVTLSVGAGLLLASFRRVAAVDPGFVSDRVLTASVMLPRNRYDDDANPLTATFADYGIPSAAELP